MSLLRKMMWVGAAYGVYKAYKMNRGPGASGRLGGPSLSSPSTTRRSSASGLLRRRGAL